MSADRKKVGTDTLLKHRSQIDDELATRPYLEVATFRQVHQKCDVTSKREGWGKVGYNATWNDYEYAPIKRLHCNKHNVDSTRFTDMKAFMAGEVSQLPY